MDQKTDQKNLAKRFRKIFFVVILALSIIGLYRAIDIFINNRVVIFSFPISILGIIAAIYCMKDKRVGNTLGIIWSALQIFIVQIGALLIDMSQAFRVNFGFSLRPEHDFGIDINILAIAFLVFFIKDRRVRFQKAMQ